MLSIFKYSVGKVKPEVKKSMEKLIVKYSEKVALKSKKSFKE